PRTVKHHIGTKKGGAPMGLTYTEILMGVEEEFGIDIDDQSLEHIRTVGDLYAYILSQPPRRSPHCIHSLPRHPPSEPPLEPRASRGSDRAVPGARRATLGAR
ncbi:MAG: hypothetical protein GY851_13660, partial [bacterium]|nr:hypothetical protein [bacterium]